MSTYNHSSSYNRTYERKVIEEGGGKPSVQISAPFQTITSTGVGFPLPSSSFIAVSFYKKEIFLLIVSVKVNFIFFFAIMTKLFYNFYNLKRMSLKCSLFL